MVTQGATLREWAELCATSFQFSGIAVFASCRCLEVICSQHKLLRVHDRANYLGNEAENAGRLEYYIVKSVLVNSVCDQISCCFKYHITCSTLVWVNEYVWMCQWICMPPNLINILTNSTSSDVWHKLYPFRSRLAKFVYVSYLFQSPFALAAEVYVPWEAGKGEQRWGNFLSSTLGPRGSWPVYIPHTEPQEKPSIQLAILVRVLSPERQWIGNGCWVPKEVLRNRNQSDRLTSMCVIWSLLSEKGMCILGVSWYCCFESWRVGAVMGNSIEMLLPECCQCAQVVWSLCTMGEEGRTSTQAYLSRKRWVLNSDIVRGSSVHLTFIF